MNKKTDVLLEGSSEWYEKKIDELQDWLLEKEIHADTPNIGRVYSDVLHKVIDMFDGANTDFSNNKFFKLIKEGNQC